MAEGIVFNIMGTLMSKFGSLVVENMRMKNDLEKLIDNMSEIKAVVLDAEELQGTNRQVQLWLNKLKDALNDADNLLDDFSYEDKKRQVLSKDCISEVCIFFTSSNSFLLSMKMGPRVRDIGKKLQDLNVEKRSLMLTTRNPVERVVKHRETHSFICEEHVIGRDKEKEYLVELLLNTNMDMKENVSIISIVGIGGLGKTALAQLLYNEKAVNDHFELKMWVCVSDDFDVKTIAKKIIGSKSDDEMDRVQLELRKKIGGKRYLLVLDDIWNEDRELWLDLMRLLRVGAKGSKIIITTRSEEVAKISGTSSPFVLDGLDEEQGWKLFCQLAFTNGQVPENDRLVSIGKEILKKCSGVPLAIRSVGSLMYSMETESDWLNFKDKDLVKIDEKLDRGKSVFEIIKLSYDHLPIHLKKCFAFCSLFPKDYGIDRMDLIRLWVAEGFVQSTDESTCLEDVGDEYFMNLVHRSFFQDLERNIFDDIYSCKMHDLMHDMAKSVLGNDCVTITEQGQHIDKQTHHVSFGFSLNSSWHVPSSLLKANKLRTFLSPLQRDTRLFGEEPLDESDCKLIMSNLEQLRVLDLNNLSSRMLPSCIDKLTHLRYLNLSSNKQIEVLPKSITKLNNLETLLLKGCTALRELPSDLWKLISLRHLDLESCEKLAYMPRGIGQLTYLQTLTLFVLDKKVKHSAGPSELRGLQNLRNDLNIKGLECLRDNPSEAMEMNLTGKSNLTSLTLTWNTQIVADDNDRDKDNLILQGLLPLHNIKSLVIDGFGGVAISCSMNQFINLRVMSLYDCMRLQSLPTLHLLLHLKALVLSNVPCLEWIHNNSNDDNNSSTFFPSLEQILLLELDNLKGWCKCVEEGNPKDCPHQLKSLEVIWIGDCPNLISLPPHKDIQDVSLVKVNETILQQAVYHSRVKVLNITKINGLKSLSGVLQHLAELRKLRISDCEELDPCNDENGSYSMKWEQLTNLRWLIFDSIHKMEYLPEGLQHITTLQSIEIGDCPNLRSKPEWTRSLQQCQITECRNSSVSPFERLLLESNLQ